MPQSHPTQQEFTRLPSPVNRTVRETAETLIANKTTVYDKVRAIYDHFNPKNGFKYSLNTKPGNSGSAMADFLRLKEGYCEQYAAAMAWLVRQAGIPSRVAFGFTRGSNRAGNTYTLNNFNLHAWTEVYFDGFGWVPFDATPAASISGSVSTAWAPDPSQPQGPVNPEPTDDLNATADPSAGASAPGLDKFGENDSSAADGGRGDRLPLVPMYIVGGLLLALFLLGLPAMRRSVLRRRRRPGRATVDAVVGVARDGPAGDPGAGVEAVGPIHGRARRDAHAAWDELIDTMIDFRVLVDPAETPRTTADRLVRERTLADRAADGAQLLGRAEERARYAREPLTDVDLAEPLGAIRRALRLGVSRRTRLLAALLPPSVLLRWRAALITRYAQTVDTFGRRRDALARAVSPRRLVAGRSTR